MDAELPRSGTIVSDIPDPAAMGSRIRECRRRRRHGLTLTKLAGLSGTGLRFVSELERGKPSVSLHKMAVLGALGLRLQILGEEP